jgi:hypothetical protein
LGSGQIGPQQLVANRVRKPVQFLVPEGAVYAGNANQPGDQNKDENAQRNLEHGLVFYHVLLHITIADKHFDYTGFGSCREKPSWLFDMNGVVWFYPAPS